jgi:primosomal protein N' (replication factor Y)
VRITTSAPDGADAQRAATEIREALGVAPPALLGPAPLFRLRGRDRFQLVLKLDPADRARGVATVGEAVERVAAARAHKAVAFSVDVDPQ